MIVMLKKLSILSKVSCSVNIEILQNCTGAWFWHIMSTNGQCLATSEAYSSKTKCTQTAKSVSKTTGLAISEKVMGRSKKA
jgi:uncharacterized protein YegP (UPF0339 family)